MAEPLCRLCFTIKADLIGIFDENGLSQNIAQIISEHFRFQINESDFLPKTICTECWNKTENFNQFYRTVEIAQNEYLSNIIKKEPIFDEPPNISETIESPPKDALAIDNEKLLKHEITDSDSEHETDSDYGDGIDDEEDDEEDDDDLDDEQDEEDITVLGIECEVISKIDNDKNPIELNETNTTTAAQTNPTDEDRMIAQYFDMSCDICNQNTASLAQARLHYQQEHDVYQGYIKCCNRKFKRRAYVLEHINWHLNPKLFTCKVCDKSCAGKNQLTAHMLIHAPEESKQYACGLCNKHFLKRHILNLHMKGVHPEKEQAFMCDICKKCFKLESTMKTHVLKVHHRSEEQICHVCARIFKTKEGFRDHLLTHTGTTEPKVQCNYCGAWLKNRGSLNKHIKTHTDSPQKCTQCDKVAPHRSALLKHIRSVHNDPIHKCSLCGKNFKRLLSLTEHMASHTGQNLYTCAYCPKMFKSNSNMYKHKKMAHPEEWSQDRAKRLPYSSVGTVNN